MPDPRVEFIPFEPAHLASLNLQASQASLQPWLAVLAGQPEQLAARVVPGWWWTGTIDGAVVGCAGVMPRWLGCATAVAMLGEIPPTAWVRVTGLVRHVLREVHRHGYRRVEASVEDGFDAGHRWAAALGFEREGLMRAYAPDGADCWLYARVR